MNVTLNIIMFDDDSIEERRSFHSVDMYILYTCKYT